MLIYILGHVIRMMKLNCTHIQLNNVVITLYKYDDNITNNVLYT